MATPTDTTIRYVTALRVKLATPTHSFSVISGRKYDKIVCTFDGASRSVHAFIERHTGDLIKAAGWTAPQKNADGTLAVRYHLGTEDGFSEAVNAADRHGGYLYTK